MCGAASGFRVSAGFLGIVHVVSNVWAVGSSNEGDVGVLGASGPLGYTGICRVHGDP